eukprot:CAMPEP_0171201220 /NCGR_PEP_ID=MMETSP0790-20130122/24380_1 /TAXON_ID=2925 /ORGANISM="Alexandrium catenella, Strain OF101" /LENGTH=226 /DNA_ID=CAMNT_0011666617 /DNA_START=33 /DNA_END=713 /DNA_ORIENTATION=-
MAVLSLIVFALALGRAGASNPGDASLLLQTQGTCERPLESEPVPALLKEMGSHTEEVHLSKYQLARLEEKAKMEEREAKVARVHDKQARQLNYDRKQQKLALERAAHAEEVKNRHEAYDREVALKEQKKQEKVRVAAEAEKRAVAAEEAGVTLLVRGGPKGKVPLKITVPRTQRMGVVAEKGAAHFGLSDIHKVRLVYKGTPIKRADLVGTHNFNNGDILDISQAD